MTVLYDTVRDLAFTDLPVFPLRFAQGALTEMAPFGHTDRARLNGLMVLHSDETDDGLCTECLSPSPCKSYRLATEDLT